MTTLIKYLTILSFFPILISCEKEDISGNLLTGTWVSADKADTLIFQNEKTFSKSFHSFLYSMNADKIRIQYKGPDKILVLPSTHNYNLNGDILIIDFTNGCYTFNRRITTYNR